MSNILLFGMGISIGGVDPVKALNAILVVLQRKGLISPQEAQEIVTAGSS